MPDEHLMKIQSDIDKMNKTFDGEDVGTDAPGTTAPGTTAPGTQAPGTQAPGTEVATTSAPTTEVPEDKDKIIEDLRRQIAEKDTTKAPKTSVPTTEVPVKFEDKDFLGDLDLDDLTRDKTLLNKAFNKVYQQAVNDTRKVLGEGVLRSIPDIVKTNIVMISNLKETSEKFFKENEDLLPFRKVVASVFEEKAAENPGKSYSDLIKDIGPEVRKRLGLQKKATQPKQGKDDPPPKLPKKGGRPGRSTEKPSTTPLQAELDEMTKSLGG